MLKTKVLVVDDSIFMQKLIARLIAEDASLEVIGFAKNGIEAVKKVKDLHPHVVTLDIEMPEMNGLEALKQIMQIRPTPVLMLSSLTQDGASATMEALKYGAVDFIPKPSGAISADLYKVKEELLSKIKLAAELPLTSLLQLGKREASKLAVQEFKAVNKPMVRPASRANSLEQILAIGTSTGGPRALEVVITALPAWFPYPVLIVQHMPAKFTKSLAQRLDRLSSIKVVEAEENQRIVGGTAYIAPGDYHMTAVQRNSEFFVALHQHPLRNGHRPSVEVLFESVSKLVGIKQHYIIMTGMGNDGAEEMARAKSAGGCSTIAESEETCVVFGMPRSAIARNCVDHIVPLDRITAKILEVTHYHRNLS